MKVSLVPHMTTPKASTPLIMLNDNGLDYHLNFQPDDGLVWVCGTCNGENVTSIADLN